MHVFVDLASGMYLFPQVDQVVQMATPPPAEGGGAAAAGRRPLPRGLCNFGNLCFMNATIQAMMGATSFCSLMQVGGWAWGLGTAL